MTTNINASSRSYSAVGDDATSPSLKCVIGAGMGVEGDFEGYNWPVLALFGIVLTTVSGNVLVCLAVYREPKMRSMFNCFLVSLAVSDVLSACLVMPLSIIKAFAGL